MPRFDEQISGSSATTGRSVVRIGDGEQGTKLELPAGIEGVSPELLAILNERFRTIEVELERAKNYELSLAVKYGRADETAASASAEPIPGAKLSLDKLGNWLLMVEAQTTGACEIFAVVDPQQTETAARQAALVKTSGAQSAAAQCLYTATVIPKLVQLYAKGAGTIKDTTKLTAIWLGRYTAGAKRFGRHQPNQYAGAIDATGEPLTDHGEEARYPASDHPDQIPEGISQPSL
jgi:hypothetical protein